VSWFPDELVSSTQTDVRLDRWVMPSHAQVARVLDGALDAAVAWVARPDDRLDLRLLWPQPLHAVTPATADRPTVAPSELRVLLADSDLSAWDSWNHYAAEFAAAAGARVVHISEGDIAGPAFHDHCLRIGKPVLSGPLRGQAALPSGLRERPIRDLTPVWCWSLVTRAGDRRPAISALREEAVALARGAGLHARPAGAFWVPSDDPHRGDVGALPVE
jgi:hypothetical protein